MYIVTLAFDIDADNIQQAAEKAVDLLQLEDNHGHLIVEVDDGNKVHVVEVDLD